MLSKISGGSLHSYTEKNKYLNPSVSDWTLL